MKNSTVQRQMAAIPCMIAIALFGSPALAADMDAAALVEQMADCARLTHPTTRLNCYDAISQSLQRETAVAEQAVAVSTAPAHDEEFSKAMAIPAVPPVATRPSAAESPRKKPLLGKKSERPPDVQLTLVNRKKDSLGRWLFYFDNGQVWRQTEKGYVSIPHGDAVPATLGSGVMGSYNLRLGGKGRKVKVRRVK